VKYVNNYLVRLHTRLVGMRREEGQTLVEYGLIIALVAIVAAVGLTVVGNDIKALLEEVGGKI
jgi:pilus assembly protein Flp/PilA